MDLFLMLILPIMVLVHGATYTAVGKIGGTYRFDGSNDYISFGQGNLGIIGDLSISVWINPTAWSGYDDIIVFGENSEVGPGNYLYSIETNGNDVGYFHEYGTGSNEAYYFNTNLGTGQWYHLVLVRTLSNKEYKLYINGSLFDSHNYTNDPTGGSESNLYMGSLKGNWIFNGLIDEAGIWNVALTPEEVTSLYNSGDGLAFQLGGGEGGESVPEFSTYVYITMIILAFGIMYYGAPKNCKI